MYKNIEKYYVSSYTASTKQVKIVGMINMRDLRYKLWISKVTFVTQL